MEKKRFYQQSNVVRKTIQTRTYRCPECHVVLFSVPETLPVPTPTEEVVCKNGHKVDVPKYDSADKIFDLC